MASFMKVVIIGGGVAGAAAASEAHALGADVTILEGSESYPPPKSGWPSILSGEAKPDMERPEPELQEFSVMGAVANGVDVVKRIVKTSRGSFDFDSLVVATGSVAEEMSFRGSRKRNVFVMSGYQDYRRLAREVRGFTRVCVYGGSPLSVSIAERVSSLGVRVVLLSPEGLLHHLGETIRREVERRASVAGLVLLRSPLEGVAGVERVEAVLASGSVYASDALILPPAFRPNPPRMEVEFGTNGGILVDEKMGSSSPGVYAAGDCAEVRLGPSSSPIMYQSTATAMGRVAGVNAAGGNAVSRLSSTVSYSFFGYEVCYGGLVEAEGVSLGTNLLQASAPARGDGLLCILLFDRDSLEVRGIQLAGAGASSYHGVISLVVSGRMKLPELAYQETSLVPTGSSQTDSSLISLAAKTGLSISRRG